MTTLPWSAIHVPMITETTAAMKPATVRLLWLCHHLAVHGCGQALTELL